MGKKTHMRADALRIDLLHRVDGNARNTGLAPSPTASAARRLISSISLRTHPTLEISISPSCAIQKIVGTLVSPYAFDTGYVFVSSSKMGNVMPNSLRNPAVSFLLFCEMPMMLTFFFP